MTENVNLAKCLYTDKSVIIGSYNFREEDQDAGFVIDTEDIGLRLKAFEYWKCAEIGLSSGPHPESIKFVIAEALPNQGKTYHIRPTK